MIISGNSSINNVYYSGYTISKIYACGGSLVWSGDTPTPPSPYADKYLTFKIKSDGARFNFSGASNTLDYSLDSGSTWTTLPTASFTPSLNSGDTIMWRGSNMLATSGEGIGHFSTYNSMPYKYDVEGNVMSLVSGDDFATATTISSYQFKKLFYNCSGMEDEHIVIPATRLRPHCYEQMFIGCTRMTSAPELPSTQLADYCYYNMFSGCYAITTAPTLPATTLTTHCYSNMFYNCGIVTLPSNYLPATAMTDSCYASMFMNCHSLTTPPNLPGTSLAQACYSDMFRGCDALTTAPSLPATTLANACYLNMFRGCSMLTTAPDLLAPTLVGQCYQEMFEDCSRLNYIKMTATDTSATASLMYWVRNVNLDGTFVKDANTTIPTGISGIPEYWDVVNI